MTFDEELDRLERLWSTEPQPPYKHVTSSYGRHCATCGAFFTTGMWPDGDYRLIQVLCPGCFAELQAALRGPNYEASKARRDAMIQQAVRAIARQNLAKGKPCVWH